MDIAHYVERLRIVPSLFQLNVMKVRRSALKDIIEKANPDDYDILKTPQENLISFVHYLLKELPESEAENDKVLLNYPNNINANCMKVILSATAQNFTCAEEHLKQLEDFKDDGFLVAEAEAESAFVYSKLGPQYNMVAISKLTKVLQEYPMQFEWKYRLALLLRRCQHPSLRILFPAEINPTKNFVRCKELFEDIITNSPNDILKALSFVEIALLYIEPNCQDVDFENLGIDVTEIRTRIIENLDKAMDLNPSKARILQESGRILNKINELPAAKQVLEHAIRIQEKDEAYHHLALTIQKLEGTTTPVVIDYLEKASRNGLNTIATIDLGKAYTKLRRPNYERALECFNGLKVYGQEYSMKRQKYENLSRCYKSMMYHADRSLKNKLFQKALEMNQKSIVFGILSWMKSTPREKFVKLDFTQLFPGRLKRFYDFRSPKEAFLQQLHIFQGKSDYTYLARLQSLIERGSLNYIKDEIKRDLDKGKHEDCLETILFLLLTDIHGIDEVVISTMMQILQLAVESHNKALASKCFMWPIDYFYNIDDSIGHFRILADSQCKEVEMVEAWLMELGMIVVRNDEDISPFYDNQEALIETMPGSVAILCIINDPNSTFLDEYPINMLPTDKPHIIPVLVGNTSTVPEVLRDRQVLTLPPTDDNKRKASWLKDLGEIIFRC